MKKIKISKDSWQKLTNKLSSLTKQVLKQQKIIETYEKMIKKANQVNKNESINKDS